VGIGAVGTFLVNVLRIVTICIIGLKVGSAAAQYFHDFYGELFFISWMLVYFAVFVFGPKMVAKMLRAKKREE
jgi:exosortase/archaeosortase family protein